MDSSSQDKWVEKWERTANRKPTVLQAVPYAAHSDKNRAEFNPDAVLELPEPLPEIVSGRDDKIGYCVMSVLPELIGCKWDSIAEAAIRTTRPSAVRLAPKGVMLSNDAVWWRVTVYLEDSVITKVTQEVKIILPKTCPNGRAFKYALTLKDMKYEAKQRDSVQRNSGPTRKRLAPAAK